MTSLGNQIGVRKDNNFNILRLVLASMVIFSHSFPVALGPGGDTREEWFNVWTHRQASSGAIAVNSFFFISGFLITASWLRSRSLGDYLLKRVLRIYPGFMVALGFSAALIWAVCPVFRANVQHPAEWCLQLLHDLPLLRMSSICQPGIFAGNPFSFMANASLWTIPFEFYCYLAVSVLGVVGLFQRRWVMLVVAAFGYEAYVLASLRTPEQVDQCMIAFLTGATAWVCQDKIPFSKWIALASLAVLAGVSQFRPWFSIVFPVAGGYCLLWLAYGPKWVLSSWADKTDLSYGTYLFAFPVQQMLAMIPALRRPALIFVFAWPITLVFAWLSWHLVEKRFLAMKRNRR